MLEEALSTFMWFGIVLCVMIVGWMIGPPLEDIGIDEQLTWFILGSWCGAFVHDSNLSRSNQNNP